MMDPRPTIAVVGTGYVGLPAALLLASAGYPVIGVDIDDNVVQAINEGVLHIDEEDLRPLMADPRVRRNLRGSHVVESADVYLIAVPTPLDPTRKIADLSMLLEAVSSVASVLERDQLVIIESTVPPMTCRSVVAPILERSGLEAGVDFQIAHCPERILPGDVFREIVENDRIIGSETEEGRRQASAIYASFVEGELLLTDDVTAELVKLMENTYRDVNIALANEFAAVAEGLGVDAAAAITLANRHPRVDILQPGIGVGGHCIPIDPWFIKEADPHNSRLIDTARRINDGMPSRVAARIRRTVADLDAPRILLVGAAYKPDTADLRESPALEVAALLTEDGYDVSVHDPLFTQYTLGESLAAVAAGMDCAVILVRHTIVMQQLQAERSSITDVMRTPRVLCF